MSTLKSRLPGLILCLIIATIAWFLGQWLPLIGAPVFAIFIGMIVAIWHTDRTHTQAGISYLSKTILQGAVVLLGFGLNLKQVLAVGAQSLPIILATIAASLLVAFPLRKSLNLDRHTATLVAVGSSICGGSAIAATAPVIKAKEEDVAQAISVIFLFNILAALLFPTLGHALGLSNDGFALFAGTAVNDTSSVTATATAWDNLHHANTLDGATIVKLTRTLAIIPITLGLSIYEMKRQQTTDNQKSFNFKKVFPIFILYFILASLITTILPLPTPLVSFLKFISKFFIVMAMSAIGLNTNIANLFKRGGKAIIMGGICWFTISCVSILMQKFMGLW
ncbi:YeiH family protein [Streptococcus thoraltensis]|uniref:YeiH family protein n=1 Tax=Streptococcus thoraltensis TaxID=55085 RepID=UPI002A81EABF|nr:YeiH family protein [Streptococcus thoraltensis]MDY4761361.1 YeiH family protein [Streptococcus thoraltensis]